MKRVLILPQGRGGSRTAPTSIEKKINHDKYEFRVDIRLRVLMKTENGDYCLVLVGDHDEVKRYLRDFR